MPNVKPDPDPANPDDGVAATTTRKLFLGRYNWIWLRKLGRRVLPIMNALRATGRWCADHVQQLAIGLVVLIAASLLGLRGYDRWFLKVEQLNSESAQRQPALLALEQKGFRVDGTLKPLSWKETRLQHINTIEAIATGHMSIEGPVVLDIYLPLTGKDEQGKAQFEGMSWDLLGCDVGNTITTEDGNAPPYEHLWATCKSGFVDVGTRKVHIWITFQRTDDIPPIPYMQNASGALPDLRELELPTTAP